MRTTLALACLVSVSACHAPLDTQREPEAYGTFGQTIYREACQRVAYTGQLADRAAGLRQTVDVSGSLGRAVCIDGAAPPADAPAKLAAITEQRSLIVTLVDTIVPQTLTADLQRMLEAMLPLHDDGTMERAIRSLGDLLDVMFNDAEFSSSLARLAHRGGYRPTSVAAGLVATVLDYPGIDDFLGKSLDLIGPGGTAEAEWKQLLAALGRELKTAQPTVDPANPERPLRLALDLLLTTDPAFGAGKVLPLAERDFRGLAIPTWESGKPAAPFVDSNGDGLADVDQEGRFVDAVGKPLAAPTPFPELGKVDTAPRDAEGRALTAPASGKPLYRFLDLDTTAIGGLAREGVTFMDRQKNITFGLLHGMQALLGPRVTRTKMYMDAGGGLASTLTYEGHDTDQSALLDLAHAFIQLLGDPNGVDTLGAVHTLLAKHESAASRAVKAMLDTKDLGKSHPQAQVPETSVLYDELAPIIVRILRVPGLAEDLVQAMKDPHTRGFAPMIGRLMAQRNQLDFSRTSGSSYPLVGGAAALDTVDPVDRKSPDSDYNRSLMQRIAHMIYDANGLQFCNKENARVAIIGIPLQQNLPRCELFKIDDLALFFVLNMASDPIRQDSSRFATTYSKASFREQITNSTVKGLVFDNGLGDGLLQLQTGIDGFTRFPSPKALTRSLFLRQADQSDFLKDTMEPVRNKDGDLFYDIHDKSIFAWETRLINNPSGFVNDDFYAAVRPMVDAFAKHDECLERDSTTGNCTRAQNAAKIFVDILAMLHKHWASPQSRYFGRQFQNTDPQGARFSYLDNVVSYEPLMVQVLTQGDLVPSILDLAPVLDTLTVDGTPGATPALPALLATAKFVFDPQATPAGVSYRNGMKSTVASDGKTPIARATPYYLMADAFAHRRRALAQVAPEQRDAWNASTSELIDQLLSVEKVGNAYRFKNRRVNALTLILVEFLQKRVATHQQAGDVEDWAQRRMTADLTDVVSGPIFAALGDFSAKVQADPVARDELYKLLGYLVDESANSAVFRTAVVTLADQVQSFLDDPALVPVARVMGAALDPEKGTVDAQLTLVKGTRQVDDKKLLLTLLRNLYRQRADGTYPASDLADVIAELNRQKPGQGGPLAAGDYRRLFGEVRDFLLDEERGFVRFLGIVKNRGPH